MSWAWDYGVLFCPNCGQKATFSEHSATAREPHGETHDDEWLTCNRCGAYTDNDEIQRANSD